MNRKEKHEFALFYLQLDSNIKINDSLIIDDAEIVRRVSLILRLAAGDVCIFFNKKISVISTITDIQKKSFSIVVKDVSLLKVLHPVINLVVPVLKREALEHVVYNATVMGVESIQFVITEKSSRSLSSKDFDRFTRIALAAAEQSKQFVLPIFLNPISLIEFLEIKKIDAIALHADVEGLGLKDFIVDFSSKQNFLLSVGPEGDLTSAERDVLKEKGFKFVRLVPAVLKSEEALTLLMGITRSFM